MVNRRPTTRRRTGTTRRRTSTYRSGTRRRRTPRTSTTLGSAFALALVALFTRASWPVRIAVLVVAVLAAVAYLVVRARRGSAADDPGPADTAAAPADAPAPPEKKDTTP